jgi:signal transduction histidine kinase
MSDVITAIKGQAVAFSEQTSSDFTVMELLNYVDILMRHELKNAIITLNTITNIDPSTTIKGNINSLVQVLNNIISNAIQAYQSNGKTNEKINFEINSDGKNIIFKIEDFAGGLPDNVAEKLFKEMITTKGKNGTGLGLFMSYSNIRAHFNGNITFKTKQGEGTSFFIHLPINK